MQEFLVRPNYLNLSRSKVLEYLYKVSLVGHLTRDHRNVKIFVKTKTGARENKVIPPPLKLISDKADFYTVSVKERPVDGRANEAVTKLLAEHFKISRSQIKLVSGATSKSKVFEIKD